jgi:hypothetical protein
LKFRHESFATETRAQTLPLPVADGASIFEAAMGLLDRIQWKGGKVRLLGVSVSSLSKAGEVLQLSLFDRPEKVVKSEKLGRARDALEARFGKGTISRASFLATGAEAPSCASPSEGSERAEETSEA